MSEVKVRVMSDGHLVLEGIKPGEAVNKAMESLGKDAFTKAGSEVLELVVEQGYAPNEAFEYLREQGRTEVESVGVVLSLVAFMTKQAEDNPEEAMEFKMRSLIARGKRLGADEVKPHILGMLAELGSKLMQECGDEADDALSGITTGVMVPGDDGKN